MGKVWVTGVWHAGVWVDSSVGDPDYVPGAGATADSESYYYYYLPKPVYPKKVDLPKKKPVLSPDEQFKKAIRDLTKTLENKT